MSELELSYRRLQRHTNPITDLVAAYGKYQGMVKTMEKCPSITRKDLAQVVARMLLNPHFLENPKEFGFILHEVNKTCAGQHLDEILATSVTTTLPVRAVLKQVDY